MREFDRRISGKVKDAARKELLPNYKHALIPDAKLSKYALNKEHPTGKHKAVAFERVLGYNINNKDLLIQEVRRGLSVNAAKMRPKTEYGQPFEVPMNIKGVNGRVAKLKTGWIVDNGETEPRLTSIYIDD